MIDIQTALYNILHSRYGRDVRQSIHDGIYQINENANEAVQTAKAMGVGTAISSPTSSSAGYVAGNLYLNDSTWDLWQCIGTDSWVNKGNIKGTKGDRGTDGTNYFVYIRYSQYYDGTDFSVSPTASSQYIGIYSGSSATAPTNKQDYTWAAYVGASGTSSYVHIMYSENADGSNFVSTPTALTKYIGFYSGSSSSAPANKSYYTWSEYVGKSGTGTGDMLKSEYAGSGVSGTVDRALTANTATTATDATNASNLKNSNGTIVSVDAITSKLAKLDTDKSATEGQALAWNDTSKKYEPQTVKGGHDMYKELKDIPKDTEGFVDIPSTDEHVMSAHAIFEVANTKTYIIPILAEVTEQGGTGVGTWCDKEPNTWTNADMTDWIGNRADHPEDVEISALLKTLDADNIEVALMYDPSTNETVYNGGWQLDTTKGCMCIRFGNTITKNANIGIKLTVTTNAN